MRTRTGALVVLLALQLAGVVSAPIAAADPKTFVLWSPRGIPGSAQRHLEKVTGVNDATSVVLATDWLMRSWMPGGDKVDRLPAGYGYPMEVIAVHPGPFSHFVPAQFQEAFRTMKRTEAIISAREERLRGEGVGLKLGFRSGRRDVSAVVPQAATGGYEAVLATRPREWSYRVRFFLVRGSDAVKKKRLRKAVIAAAGDIPLEIRSGKNDLLRYAPSIKPIASFKSRFGEFPAQPSSSGAFNIHPDWVGSHIRTESVPLLGNVRCHKKLFRQLRGALGELRDKGLGYLIRPDEYAGCYNPRFTALPPGTRLSRHSWGIAVDVNTEGNGLGQEPHQDPRLVKIMRKWGFVWGGTWLTPDGMHFEWGRFPD